MSASGVRRDKAALSSGCKAPPCCFGATPLVAKLPRRSAPTDAHSTPRARIGDSGVNAGAAAERRGRRLEPEINKTKSATAPPATSPSCGLQPRPRPGGPSRSSSIDPPKPINQNYAAPDSSAPTSPRDKGIPPEMPERQHAGAPDAVLARPLSLPSYPVGPR